MPASIRASTRSRGMARSRSICSAARLDARRERPAPPRRSPRAPSRRRPRLSALSGRSAGARELAPAGHGRIQVAGRLGEHLDADVVGARGVVLGDALGDLPRLTPGDERVDQALAAAVGNVVVGEAEPQQVVDVVRRVQVAVGGGARDRRGRGRRRSRARPSARAPRSCLARPPRARCACARRA